VKGLSRVSTPAAPRLPLPPCAGRVAFTSGGSATPRTAVRWVEGALSCGCCAPSATLGKPHTDRVVYSMAPAHNVSRVLGVRRETDTGSSGRELDADGIV